MQTCENINISSIIPSDYILHRFTVLGLLGMGLGGIVIKVLDTEKNEVVALKSQVVVGDSITDFDISEVKIGCNLLPTRAFTNGVVIPQEWAITKGHIFLDGTHTSLPNWFDENLSKHIDNMLLKIPRELFTRKLIPRELYAGKLDLQKLISNGIILQNLFSHGLVFTMPLMDSTLYDKISTLTDDEKRDILFELIVILRVLNNMGMAHGDLHDENILLKQTKELRSYTIQGIQHIVKSQYMPVLVDFEYMKINKPSWLLRDWEEIRDFFFVHRNIPSDVRILLSEANVSVLLNKFFQPLREQSVDPESLIRIFAPLESL